MPTDAATEPEAAAASAVQHPGNEVRWILGMGATIAVPAVLTMATVRSAPDPGRPDHEDTPYGYTVSLSLFAIPLVVLMVVRHFRRNDPLHLRALLWAGAVIAVLGFVLDLFFGHSFFTFLNPHATIGVRLPAWSWTDLQWVPRYLPVEEFGFYILGSLFVVALYQFADADWLRQYRVNDFAILAREHRQILRVRWRMVIWWGLAVALGFLAKRLGPLPEGWPGYFVFIMVLGFLPTFLFMHTVQRFVNWRAFTFAFLNLMFISLLWEATLGVPYNWWNYHHERMLGIRLLAWASLPLEAVLLWLIITWDCIIAYEVFRVFFHMDRGIRDAMLGVRPRR
jgi:hypothetical protein